MVQKKNHLYHSKNHPISTFNSIAIQPDAQEAGINLDEKPTSEHVISSVLKSRPKIPQKRKLPSKVSHKFSRDSSSEPHIQNGRIDVHEEQQEKEAQQRLRQERERQDEESRRKEREEKEKLEK